MYRQGLLGCVLLLVATSLAPQVACGQGSQQVVLQIKNETFTDQTFFFFSEQGKTGSDPFDAFKLPSLASAYTELYSQDTGGNHYSINALPKDLQEILEIPVFIRSTVADTFTVWVTKLENIQPNWTLSLVNLSTNDTLSLENTSSVEVIHSGNFESGILTVQHFILIINPGIVTQQVSIPGTSGKDGWRFLGSSYSNRSYGELLDLVWTQGASGSNEPSSAPNIFTWNESGQTFESVTDLNVVPALGDGFISYIYEDDNPLTPGVDGGWPKSLHTSGIAGFGTVQLPVTYTPGADASLNGFNLVANPYPFPIDWNAPSGWVKTNIQDAIWIWDPNENSGSGDYLEHISGIGDAINVIAPHQAFWVRANNENPELTVNESVKSKGASLLKKQNQIPALAFKVKSESFGFEDTHYLSFREHGSISHDDHDMTKLSPVSQDYLNLYSLSGQEKLAVNNLPIDFSWLEIPIQVNHSFSGEFTLSWESIHPLPENTHIRLFDDKYELYTDEGSYTFQSDSAEIHDFTLILEKEVATSSETVKNFLTELELFQNYPNPFNPVTTITYKLPELSRIRLEVFDMLGRKVATLVESQQQKAGRYTVNFDATQLSSGMYIYRLVGGNKTITKKLTLIK